MGRGERPRHPRLSLRAWAQPGQAPARHVSPARVAGRSRRSAVARLAAAKSSGREGKPLLVLRKSTVSPSPARWSQVRGARAGSLHLTPGLGGPVWCGAEGPGPRVAAVFPGTGGEARAPQALCCALRVSTPPRRGLQDGPGTSLTQRAGWWVSTLKGRLPGTKLTGPGGQAEAVLSPLQEWAGLGGPVCRPLDPGCRASSVQLHAGGPDCGSGTCSGLGYSLGSRKPPPAVWLSLVWLLSVLSVSYLSGAPICPISCLSPCPVPCLSLCAVCPWALAHDWALALL